MELSEAVHPLSENTPKFADVVIVPLEGIFLRKSQSCKGGKC